jgi:hypothetical protein
MYENCPLDLEMHGTHFNEMDIDFVGEKDTFIIICLDDMIVFSKSNQYHLKHLRQTFTK